MKKLNILFICKYNRFRSRIAEAYFNKINKNKNIKVKSAGLIKGNPISKRIIDLAKKFKLDIRGNTQGISSKLLIWQNITIIVANDVPKKIFSNNIRHGKKVIVWKIADSTSKDTQKSQEKRIIQIMKKVDKLPKQLEVRK